MKSRILTFLSGLIMGAVFFGGTTAIAAGIMAQPSWSPIYVDGRQVQMTAYNIAGNNYVKLRDIGQAVGFNVYFANGVQVDSDAPYTGTAPAIATAQPAPAESIRVSCYKEGPLMAGDSSGLMIYPSGLEYTVTSSNPAVAAVEKATGQFWKVRAVSPGTAVITAVSPDERTGSATVTVTSEGPKETTNSGTTKNPTVDLSANMDIRQEMIRLINQTRQANGVRELVVNDALMNAAQDCSAQMFRSHNSEYECGTALAYGYPHGFGDNLTWFTGSDYMKNVAQTAVNNWINSPGHFQTMVADYYECVGVGVTIENGKACCYMFAGDPNSINAYS